MRLTTAISLWLAQSCRALPDTAPSPDLTRDTVADTALGPTDTGDPNLIVDIHAHPLPARQPGRDKYYADLAAIARLKDVRIVLGLNARHLEVRPPTYSTQHDDWALEAVTAYPDVYSASLAGFDPADEDSVDYVASELATGRYVAIGELDLRNGCKETRTPANQPNLMKVYELAAQYDVPVILHFQQCYETICALGESELDDAIGQNPLTTFVVAHRCSPDMLAKHSNLECEYEVTVGGFPEADFDRVMLGTDLQRPDLLVGREQDDLIPYADAIVQMRSELAALSPEDAERVANGNARRLGLVR